MRFRAAIGGSAERSMLGPKCAAPVGLAPIRCGLDQFLQNSVVSLLATGYLGKPRYRATTRVTSSCCR